MLSLQEHIKLQTEAHHLGISYTDIAAILAKYGPEALSLVISALRSGLSLPLIIQILQFLGPIFLQKAIDHVNSVPHDSENDWPQVAAENCEGPASVLHEPVVGDSTFVLFLLSILPGLIRKYGPGFLEWLANVIETAETNTTTKARLVEVINEALGY